MVRSSGSGGFPGGVFLQAAGSANDHDLGLFQSSDPGVAHRTGRVGLYHLAWEVDTLRELGRIKDVLRAAGALTGASDHACTKAVYEMTAPTRPLDLPAEIARYGADTPGGPRIDHSIWQRFRAETAN